MGILARFFLIVSALVLIFGGFDLKQYYVNFWRLGSFRIDSDVKHVLQSKVKEDSLIIFDGFPASNLIMVANPLTKDLRLDQYNVFIRDDLYVDKEKNQLLIYRISQDGLDLFREKDLLKESLRRLMKLIENVQSWMQILIQESLRLNPERSFIPVLMAEAYKKEGCYQEAQAEYKKLFGQDVRSPQILERAMYDNPVVLVWHDKFDWHIFFRSEERSHFYGTILADRRFKDFKKHGFVRKDTLSFSDVKVEFSLELDRRRIKAIEFPFNSWFLS